MRSAVPRFRTPAAPWAMMRSPRRTAAAMPKRSPPLPSIDCRMASILTGALSSSDEPAGLNRLDFDASIMFYRGRTGLGTGTAPINLLDSSRRMWSIHQPTKCSNRWFRFTGYRAAKQQDSDLAPDSRRAPSGVYVRTARAFLLLHSLRWVDSQHAGASTLRVIAGLVWAVEAFV